MFSYDDIENIMCPQSAMIELNNLNDLMGGEPALKDEGVFITSISDEECHSIRSVIQDTIAQCRLKKSGGAVTSTSTVTSTTKQGVERLWNREELSALSKSIRKFPAGVPNRWSNVAQEMTTILKPEHAYNVDECLRVSSNIVKMMTAAK